MTDDPAEALPMLLQCLRAAGIASNSAMRARVLARLMSTSAAAGHLALAARCLGALDALGKPPADEATQHLERTSRRPSYGRGLWGRYFQIDQRELCLVAGRACFGTRRA